MYFFITTYVLNVTSNSLFSSSFMSCPIKGIFKVVLKVETYNIEHASEETKTIKFSLNIIMSSKG